MIIPSYQSEKLSELQTMLEAGRADPLPITDHLELRRLLEALCYASKVTDKRPVLGCFGGLRLQTSLSVRSFPQWTIAIPKNIITKAPSAELRPNQKDTDSLPEYVKLDEILFNYIENQLGWQQIVDLGFDERLVRKVVKMVDQNVYKRFQAPPTLRISSKAFGLGRQMPIVGKYHF